MHAASRSISWMVTLLSLQLLVGCGGGQESVVDDSVSSYLEAQKALQANDADLAYQHLTAAIEQQPQPWAYFDRAKILHERGDVQAALEDAEAGLKLRPKDAQLRWFVGELKKPEGKRFQGRYKDPPPPRR